MLNQKYMSPDSQKNQYWCYKFAQRTSNYHIISNQTREYHFKKAGRRRQLFKLKHITNNSTLNPMPNLPIWSGSSVSGCLCPKETILTISLWVIPCPSSLTDSIGISSPAFFEYIISIEMPNLLNMQKL